MFTPDIRNKLRSSLLEMARADRRITGAAITGSAAIGAEDQWSDIDLAFAVRQADEVQNVVSDWTRLMYEEHLALHHVDVIAGAWLYRVFLLPSTLQVDLAFVPSADFRALAPSFKLVFGEANPARHAEPRGAGDLIGWGWLYALHARTCLVRKRHRQAEYMISGLRDTALALACLRHGLPPVHARGADALPDSVASRFDAALVTKLDASELWRAFRAAVDGLLDEIRQVDTDLELRLRDLLTSLTRA
jgi:hypothetical protein